MSSYSVPENIRKLKPKGTMVKVIHNKYYVYEHSRIKRDGKWITKMGKLIGSIDPLIGFIPNDSMRKDEITSVDFGEYYLAYSLSKNVLDDLISVFNIKDAYTIYFLSLIHFINGFTYLKDIDSLYRMSYLSIKYNETLSFKEKSVSNLYDSLGRRQNKVNEFEDYLISKSSKELAIDGHCIKSASDDNDLSETGNKANLFKDDQLNVLMAYDINTSKPVLSRVYSGGTLDKISIKDLIERKNLNSLLFIVDKGFYSKENISLFSSNDNHYIIPLWANHKLYKKITTKGSMENLFVFERSKKRSTVEYREEVFEDKKVIYYRDLSQNALECTDYLSKVEDGKYTMEDYLEKKDSFGTIVLESNLDKSAEEIYKLYKKRWMIETFYDYYKNKLDVNTLHLGDYYKTQGLSFIMLIASLIYSEVNKSIKEKKIKDSIETILLDARFLKLHKSNNKWNVENINQKHLEIFHMFNLNVNEEALSLIKN